MACTITFPSLELSLPFSNGKVIVDIKFLKEKVSPLLFIGLEAILSIGSEEIKVPLQPTSNYAGEDFYVLEESLSCYYYVMVDKSLASSPSPITILDSPHGEVHIESNMIYLRTPNTNTCGAFNSKFISTEGRSIIEFLTSMKKGNTITKLLGRVKEVVKVIKLPRQYNGDIIFEFPTKMRLCSIMNAIEHRYGPHIWCKL